MSKQQNEQDSAGGCLLLILILAIFLVYQCNKGEKEKPDLSSELSPAEIAENKRHEDSIAVLSALTEMDTAYAKLKGVEVGPDEIEKFRSLSFRLRETKHADRLRKTQDSIERVYAKQVEISTSADRAAYESTLRNSFLDNNLDIEVTVYGRNNTKIKLTYILFTDVWFRKFETEGYFTLLYKEGFRYIEFTDGYDYGRSLSYD
jgi:hypothetical protein